MKDNKLLSTLDVIGTVMMIIIFILIVTSKITIISTERLADLGVDVAYRETESILRFVSENNYNGDDISNIIRYDKDNIKFFEFVLKDDILVRKSVTDRRIKHLTGEYRIAALTSSDEKDIINIINYILSSEEFNPNGLEDAIREAKNNEGSKIILDKIVDDRLECNMSVLSYDGELLVEIIIGRK